MLLDLGADVELPDLEAAQRYRDATAHETGRGALRDIAQWLASVQGSDRPKAPARVRLVRIGFEDDREHTAQADATGGTDDITAAIERGVAIADDEVDRGTDLLVLAVAHHGVAAEAIVAALTSTEPVKVLPRGTALTADEWMHRAERVRDLRRAAFRVRDSADEVLAAVGDTAIAAGTGVLMRATARRTAVLLDGLAAVTAGLLAYQVQGRTAPWWRAADASGHPAQERALDLLGHHALLALATSTDDGTAGLFAAELIRVAVGSARPGLI